MDFLKNLDSIITAEDYLKKKFPEFEDLNNQNIWNNIEEAMIEFAKLHVQKALKKASKKAFVEYIDLTNNKIFDYTDVITDDDVGANVNKNSILNAYPLKNIK